LNNKTISFEIIDSATGEVVLKEDNIDFGRCRLVLFKDGFIDIVGGLPWKIVKAPLRAWAHEWAEAHSGEFETLVRQYRPEATDEEIISLLEYMNKEATALLPTNDKRNAVVASHISQVIVKAVTMTAMKVVNKTRTIWEFPQSMTGKTDSNSILVWLFRRR
jgi:hypothetical protein